MIAVIDIETTGLDYWRCEILTLSIGLYEDNSSLIAEREFCFKPERMKYWSDQAGAVHKISKEKALTFPDKNDSWEDFFILLDWYIKEPIHLVCHAKYITSYFDRAFLDCQMDLMGRLFELRKYFKSTISTHTICQDLRTARVYNFEKLSLDYICTYFKINLDHHNAKSDREACAKIYFLTKEKHEKIIKEQCRAEAERLSSEDKENCSHRALSPEFRRKKRGKSTKLG